MPPVAPPMGMYPWYRTRVQNHAQTLGILWILFGTYRIIGGITATFFLHTFLRNGMFGDTPPVFLHMVSAMGPAIFGLAVILGVASIVTGYGLLMGTALGIYTLWALAPAASGVEWESLIHPQPVQQA
jgi:hypothetical protein